MSYADSLHEHLAVFAALERMGSDVEKAAHACALSLAHGGRILLCGNGGSAADAQHVAAELTGRFVKDRRPFAGIALTTDTSALTAIGNDYGFDEVFARQVEAIGRPGDVLVAISTSGRSQNVINALREARNASMKSIGLLGKDGGDAALWCDYALIVPCNTTARIQEAHGFLGHMLCQLIEEALDI